METQPKRHSNPLWNKALERYRAELEEDSVDEYQTILEAGTLEELVEQIKTIQPPNAREKAVVNRLDSVFKFINDFLRLSLIRIILTLASSTNDTLQDIVDVLEELSLTLPRFRYYERTLPLDEAFEAALVDVYTVVICFYARTIHFYRVNPHGVPRRNAWADFHGDFSKTIQRIKRLSSAVESEADAARMRLEKNGYAEVLDLMKTLKESKLSPDVKPYYCMPHGVNSRFWGREDILLKLKDSLDPNVHEEGQRSVALWGMGGVGKTQVALRYASSSRQCFQTILWISADSNIQLLQSFREVASQLGIIQAHEATEDAMAAMMKVKTWLSEASMLPDSSMRNTSLQVKGHRWLLIFDNAEDLEILGHAWPYDAQGSILVTTRNPNIAFDPAAGGVHIQPFDDAEGAKFLLKLIDVDANSQVNQDFAKEIAHALGSLPLALNQIGGFINQRKMPLKDFLPLYRRNVERIDSKKTGTVNYEHSISTVWEMTLNRLSGSARLLQQILAFLDPDKIDQAVVIGGSQALVENRPDMEFLGDELDLLDAEEVLLQNALIDKTSETGFLSIHRLVQAAVIRRLSSGEKVTCFDAVVRLLCWGFSDTFSEDVGHQHQSWENSEKCLPHIDHVIKIKEEYRIKPPDPQYYAQVLLRCSWYLYEREYYDTARVFMKEALDNFQDRASLAFASAVELLGLIDMDTNFQREALQSFTQSLEIRKNLLGPDDPFIAASLTTLGIVHTELGDLNESYAYHSKAIDIRLRTKSDRIGNSYSNMSSLLLRMGKADEAEAMLKRCPSLKDFTDETFLKTGNPRFSGDMVLLARIRERQGRLEEATSLASKALSFRQRLLGNRLKTCDSLYQVACMLEKRRKIASAMDLLHECAAIAQSLPEGEGQLARAWYKLHTLYAQDGKSKESEELLVKARTLRRKLLGCSELEGDDSEESYNSLNLWMLW
ncbi:MAG: hypothetical protein Q9213_005995 [Squamulea squamosa]